MNQKHPPMTSAEKNTFAQQVLHQIGAPVNDANMAVMTAWMDREGSISDYNPLNTTLKYGNCTNFNNVGVKNFETDLDGVMATAKTLKGYPSLVTAFKAGEPWTAVDGDAAMRKWSNNEYGFGEILSSAAKKTSDPNLKAAAANYQPTDAYTDRKISYVNVGPTAADAARNYAHPIVKDVSNLTPLTPIQVVQEGLDLASWYERNPCLVGNSKIHQTGWPVVFELRLNRADNTSLTGRDGTPIQVRLNTSLTSVSTRSQHIVSREPQAVGMMVTLWGSQPDTLVGRGTTGAFMNQFGLAALMSCRLTAQAASWYSLIQSAWASNPEGLKAIIGAGGKSPDVFRVAAQDAFVELLSLFKNNGVTRYLPMPSWAEDVMQRTSSATNAYKQAQQALNAYKQDGTVWSPSAGATGYQIKARAGDIYTRGHVVLKYKGREHLGYFKALQFMASASSPFKWDFDFTFRVLKSYTPIFQKSTT